MAFAVVFPGQGSQSVGMLADLATEYSEVGETFSEASDVLGYDLWALCQNGPDSDLNQTDKTQPAMLAAGIAVWRAWRSAGGDKPSAMAGHSLGEYTALVAAGALQFADAVKLVELRGRYMQAAVPAGQGAMAAVLGLADQDVIAVCEEASEGEVVQAVNFNSPGQVVIAGATSAVERAVDLAKDKGAKRALILPVSVPSHCSLMMPAAENLRQALADVQIAVPNMDVIHNCDVAFHQDADSIRDALVKQLHSPVRWVETIKYISDEGMEQIVECGPGKVLAGLTKRIDKSVKALAITDTASLQTALAGIAD